MSDHKVEVKLLNKADIEKIMNLVDDLGWDYQSLTTRGRETYKELCSKLGWKFEWDDEELG